jgi:hypothetical protein
MVSDILTVACKILKKDENIPKIQELGEELGKLIYVYDGLLDYQNDLNLGLFNCIHSCFIRNRYPSTELADQITDYILQIKTNIKQIIDLFDFQKGSTLIEMILLQPL